MASWSKTYGMTDDVTPTAIPAAIATGSEKASCGAREPDRRDEEEGEQHCRGQAVDPAQSRAPRNTVREDDVGGEQRSVCERERDADRLALEPHVRQQEDAGGRRPDRGDVAPRARTDRRQRDRPDELDRRDRRQRQPVDRDVEADIHRGKHGSQGDDQRPSAAIEREKRPPGPPPKRRRSPRPKRSGARRRRARRPGRREAPRRKVRGSGRRRCRRSTPARARRRRGAACVGRERRWT